MKLYILSLGKLVLSAHLSEEEALDKIKSEPMMSDVTDHRVKPNGWGQKVHSTVFYSGRWSNSGYAITEVDAPEVKES